MATVYAKANKVAAQCAETRDAVRGERNKVTRRAKDNLAKANKTSRITQEGYFPAEIEEVDGAVDFHTVLHAPNAMALEFGHDPSGFFAGTDTKPPAAEYILTRAAIGGVVS
ncbi:head-to-tail connector protein [Mycobacterium phage Drake55]|nr:head-to-tail connector protein [Mycobacterium phage Drake55]